jgi:hypothetical protein
MYILGALRQMIRFWGDAGLAANLWPLLPEIHYYNWFKGLALEKSAEFPIFQNLRAE